MPIPPHVQKIIDSWAVYKMDVNDPTFKSWKEIEEIRNNDKGNWFASSQTIVSNSSRQMGLTTAGNAHEYQPACGRVGKVDGYAMGLF